MTLGVRKIVSDNSNIKIYAAPLEGITGHVFRNSLHTYFDHIDKYFIPFIKPNQKGNFSSREKEDIIPEHNAGMHAVPQILTNSAEDFVKTAQKLKTYGYNEVNLNLGCPSKTVINKKRGSGFLAYPDELDRFLDEIFEQADILISIKTRLGMDEPEEFSELLKIYNKYPLNELIIHPRVQKDFYKNYPRLEMFARALAECCHPVCYNGDIFTKEDYCVFKEQFPFVSHIMLGRGLLKNPALAREIITGQKLDKEALKNFHDHIYAQYRQILPGDKTVLFKMKELWSYLAPVFTDYKKHAKKIKKAERLYVYEEAVEALFKEEI